MKIKLSLRLDAVANLVSQGMFVADIGTDHAYVPIALVERGIVPKALAMDINKGPLQIARENIKTFGLEKQIETCLSDGLRALEDYKVESVVIAGMGGGLLMDILSASRTLLGSVKEFILQPQSELYKVRAFLLDQGFSFLAEEMVFDGGKYYPMMKVAPVCFANKDMCAWSEVEITYGKLLLAQQHPVLKEYLLWKKTIKGKVIKELAHRQGEAICTRKKELKKEWKLIEEGLQYYDMS
ncbi:MAG: class I SAM-dependent methyltransferase [Lachnospiraceae bacterium]|nr:class I SAM-dependent methyltransferase [Lachnospiraceae bacterium]